MGNTSSGEVARRSHYAATLPHDQRQRNHTPKVLPDLEENPRLRSTDNGVIIQSGGTISGRRPQSATLPNHAQNQHGGMYRSRSASGEEADGRPARRALRRERDPLHRSQTHLDMHRNPGAPASVKKFGSEPDLRNEEEQPKTKANKHFRKKYKAPAPPQNTNGDREGSSPDSYEDGSRGQPMRRLRLFKTRTESKKLTTLSSDSTSKFSYTNDSLEFNDQTEILENRSLERRYKSPTREKEPCLQYPNSKDMDMVQSTTSLKREENILQAGLIKQEFKKNKNDKYNVHKSKSNKAPDRLEPNSQPHLERKFRHSERFKKESQINPIVLRREKSFDATLSKEANLDEVDYSQPDRNRSLVEQYRKSDENQSLLCQPQRKSLPSLLALNANEKDEFQAELIRATSRIRSDLIRSRISEPRKDISKTEETSQNNKYGHNKINNNKEVDVKDVKKRDKAKESSRKPVHLAASKNDTARETHVAKIHVELQKPYRIPAKQDDKRNFENTSNTTASKVKVEEKKPELVQFKRESRGLVDRGRGSGKESTPEQSLNRVNESDKIWDTRDANPKQFYFGMIESNDIKITDKVKEFPGLGAPINGEFKNFDIIEKKLLNYPNDEMEVEKFANKIQHTTLNNRNLSSESALSSEPEIDDHNSDEHSQGIALHLRPTLPKKQLEIPRFSPAAAWRQLAAMEAIRGTSPLAVETKPAPDSVASEAAGRGSLDKSADSGISGDTPHDDRLDSPPRSNQHVLAPQSRPIISAWTPQQDLEGDSSSDPGQESPSLQPLNDTAPAKFSARNQVFSLSLPREAHFANSAEKSKQLQQPFNSLQKLKKSVSGALGAALGTKRPEDQEHIMDDQSDQNWFLSKSAPNSLSNAFLYPHQMRQPKEISHKNIGEEVTPPVSDQEEEERPPAVIPSMLRQQPPFSYLATGGHVMYLPRYDSQREPASYQHEDRRRTDSSTKLWRDERLLRTKSSGEIELRSRKQEPSPAEEPQRHEMRERNQSVSPALPRAKRQVDQPKSLDACQGKGRGKRFTFQSTVRQLERRRLAERLSREADLKELQRKNELEAMRRVEEEFQRKRAREKASIRQQLRLVSGSTSLPPLTAHQHPPQQQPARDDPDGAVSSSPSPGRGDTRGDQRTSPDVCDKQSPYVGRLSNSRAARTAEPARRHSKNSSSTHSKSTTNSGPTTRVLSEWRVGGERRQYRDWGAPASIDHPPACYRMPNANHNGNDREFEGFSGSPRSDNYRLEFARGSHGSSSGSELSAHRTRKPQSDETNTSARSDKAEPEVTAKGGREPEIVPTLLKAPPAPIIRGELLKIH